MNIRALGATGIRVGEIGMGCEGFIGKTRQEVREFLDVMERSGANLIDLYSPDPEMRSALGEAMAGRRDSRRICARSGKTGSTSAPAISARCVRALRISWRAWGLHGWISP